CRGRSFRPWKDHRQGRGRRKADLPRDLRSLQIACACRGMRRAEPSNDHRGRPDPRTSRGNRAMGRLAKELTSSAVSAKKTRLDVALVDRGLASSRERARALILAGEVMVDGHRVSKAGAAIAAGAQIELKAPDHPYVSRGGVKLAGALDAFQIAVAGR